MKITGFFSVNPIVFFRAFFEYQPFRSEIPRTKIYILLKITKVVYRANGT